MNLFPKIPEAAACYGQTFRCVNSTYYQNCEPFDSRYPRRTTASSVSLRCPEEEHCDDRSDNPCEFFSIHAHRLKWPHRIILKRPNQLRKIWPNEEEYIEEGPDTPEGEEVEEEDKFKPNPDHVEEIGVEEVGPPDSNETEEVDNEVDVISGGDHNSEHHVHPEGGPDVEEGPEEHKEEFVVDSSLPENPIPESTTTVVAPSQPPTTTSTKAPTKTTVQPNFEEHCSSIGRHPYPRDCEKYIFCTRNDIYIYSCPKDFAFNRFTYTCMRDWESCPHISICTFNGQKLTAPRDPNGYLLCVSRFNGDKFDDEEPNKQTDLAKWSFYRVYKRSCPEDEIFNMSSGKCSKAEGQHFFLNFSF